MNNSWILSDHTETDYSWRCSGWWTVAEGVTEERYLGVIINARVKKLNGTINRIVAILEDLKNILRGDRFHQIVGRLEARPISDFWRSVFLCHINIWVNLTRTEFAALNGIVLFTYMVLPTFASLSNWLETSHGIKSSTVDNRNFKKSSK